MNRKLRNKLFETKAKMCALGTSLYKSAKETGEIPGAAFDSAEKIYTMKSKNGKISVTLSSDKALCYNVYFGKNHVVKNSHIGLTVRGTDIGNDVLLGTPTESSHYEEYKDRGNDNLAVDEHISYIFPVKHIPTGFQYQIEFRVWNDAVGFRMIFRKGSDLLIDEETTTFDMPQNSTCRYQTDTFKMQGKTLNEKAGNMPFDLTVTCMATFELEANAGYAMLTESNLKNYPGAALKSLGNGLFKIDFWDSGKFYIDGGETPWRLIILCETLNELANCKAIKNAAEPELEMFKDADWIKPGKSAWSFFVDKPISRKYHTIMKYNRYAEEMGYEYSIIDEGWRKWAITETGAFNKVRNVVNDAKKRNVGIFLWKAITRGPYYTLYRKIFFWNCRRVGIKGVKMDFIESETQFQINLYRKILEEAAKSKIMILYHNPQKPTGLSRTYPNLMSMEAIRGLQGGCDTDDDTVLPFTRMVGGDADYTPLCFTEPSLRNEASVPHMLASAVIYMSSFLTASGDPHLMSQHIAADFVRNLPTTWDKLIVLPQSKIGELAVLARQKGKDWYIAAHNSNKNEKEINITLDFLSEDDNLVIELFVDDLSDAMGCERKTKPVSKGDTVNIKMRKGGGFVGIIKGQ